MYIIKTMLKTIYSPKTNKNELKCKSALFNITFKNYPAVKIQKKEIEYENTNYHEIPLEKDSKTKVNWRL